MSSKVAVIIVGINQWEQYTKPLVDKLREYEPSVEIVVVDNASDDPYPEADYIYHTERLSYSAAINYGVSKTDADWILSMNNDVACLGNFLNVIEDLTPDKIYARQIIEEKGFVWFGNWIVLIPRAVWDQVGEFDPNFIMCGFEDADYALRAAKLNIPTVAVDLPFHHYWGKTRWALPAYPEVRIKNMEYLAQKHGVLLGQNVSVTHD
jgi:GT2 family glycosyltransferase